jgi:hypothetical protein
LFAENLELEKVDGFEKRLKHQRLDYFDGIRV